MSGNRAVQAAQRRRAGQGTSEPSIPGRSPQPSINSAQIFANQSRSGNGPSIPSGRLAAQQVASQQQQQSGPKIERLSNINKMTIPQAITLITLRLGAIESKLLNFTENGPIINIDGDTDLEAGFLQSIVSRLESLEKRSTSNTGSASTPELNLLKQQFETLKQAVFQSKSSTTSLVKENVSLKTQIDTLRKELTETKELLSMVQNISLENSQKILELSMENYEGAELINDENNLNEEFQNEEYNIFDGLNQESEIVGTDLKKIIESELNE